MISAASQGLTPYSSFIIAKTRLSRTCHIVGTPSDGEWTVLTSTSHVVDISHLIHQVLGSLQLSGQYLSDHGWQGQDGDSAASSDMPISNAQPAWKPRSPSPVVSMNVGAFQACRPDLDSVTRLIRDFRFADQAAFRVIVALEHECLGASESETPASIFLWLATLGPGLA